MEDFDINILNCNSDRDTSSFNDTVYSNSFYPTAKFHLESQALLRH